MQPPRTINVLDAHGGFTAETPSGRRRADGYQSTNTLFRPANVLKKGTTGTLINYDERSFYQNNNDVTMARYKVPGYRYPVIVWFDNPTGRRISGVSFMNTGSAEHWRHGTGEFAPPPPPPTQAEIEKLPTDSRLPAFVSDELRMTKSMMREIVKQCGRPPRGSRLRLNALRPYGNNPYSVTSYSVDYHYNKRNPKHNAYRQRVLDTTMADPYHGSWSSLSGPGGASIPVKDIGHVKPSRGPLGGKRRHAAATKSHGLGKGIAEVRRLLRGR